MTLKRSEALKKCLACIAGQELTAGSSCYEILVSDDCPDGSATEIVDCFPGVRWVKGPGRGVAANRNHAAKAARGAWIVYVDDDELPEPSWLEEIHKAASSGRWDVIEGRVLPVNYPDSIFWYAPTVPYGGVFCTANLAIRRQTLFLLGAFDEKLTVSHEDMDLGRRIRAAGIPTIFLPSATVQHPARKRSLAEVVNTAIQQQKQTYLLQHAGRHKQGVGFVFVLGVLAWTARYLVRCVRIQFSFTDRRNWKRFVLAGLVNLICAPVGILSVCRTEFHGSK